MGDAPVELRDRIVRAAARLLSQGGREAVSTRAVSAAAGVQAPAIYRHFGDMHDLLHAAAREVLAGYVAEKRQAAPAADPVEDLRRGWDQHVAFGLANPAAYALLYADPITANGPEAQAGMVHLTALVARVAKAGRLRVSVPMAVKMIHAAGSGVTLTLITTSPEGRDLRLATAMRDAIFAAILTGDRAVANEAAERVVARAVGLRAVVDDTEGVLSAAERRLMTEWLDRIAEAETGRRPLPPSRRRGRRQTTRHTV